MTVKSWLDGKRERNQQQKKKLRTKTSMKRERRVFLVQLRLPAIPLCLFHMREKRETERETDEEGGITNRAVMHISLTNYGHHCTTIAKDYCTLVANVNTQPIKLDG